MNLAKLENYCFLVTIIAIDILFSSGAIAETDPVRTSQPTWLSIPAIYPKNSSNKFQNLFKPLIPSPAPTQPLNLQLESRVSGDRRSMLEAISNTATKYPWFINPTDSLTFNPLLLKPNQTENYINLDTKLAERNPLINRLTLARFPKNQQFYWALPNNRLVVETQGWQFGILHQGKSTEIEIRQSVTLTQALSGLQAIWVIPQSFQDLTGKIDLNRFTIQSTAGQLVNPPGIPANPVIINSSFDRNNDIILINDGNNLTPNPTATGTLFPSLNPEKPPLILQAFPTNNLQPLLANGQVSLTRGSIIPRETLQVLSLAWGNPQTNQNSPFQRNTSLPGLKFLDKDKFDNSDLFNLLNNPSLNPGERDFHYLNSLFWFSFGQRPPEVSITSESLDYNWYKVYLIRPHNRSLIKYDPIKISATYSNVFSNPGFSLFATFQESRIDGIQTANASLGMLLGSIFEKINLSELQRSLQEARARFDRQENFTLLNTKATLEQRRQINQRLNSSLFYANRGSGLKQVSGTVTFPSIVTPKASYLFQIRTGNYQRAIQFINSKIYPVVEGDTFISNLRLSNQEFGPLTFINLPVPAINESSAVEVVLTSPNNQQFVQRFNSSDVTAIPINTRAFALAFDRIELTRIDRQKSRFNLFNGYLSLPALEVLWGGSSGNFNYVLNTGGWLNLNAKSAVNVFNNNQGLPEPTAGFYMNGLLNWMVTDVEVNAENQIQAIATQIPLFLVHWNSATNSNNPSYAMMSYSFLRQSRNLGYSLNLGVSVLDEDRQATRLGFFHGKFRVVPFFGGELGLKTGWGFQANLECDRQIFGTVESTKRVSPDWSTGVYLRNFQNINFGLNSRVSTFSYGFIFRNFSHENKVLFESQVGIADKSFEARFSGEYQF